MTHAMLWYSLVVLVVTFPIRAMAGKGENAAPFLGLYVVVFVFLPLAAAFVIAAVLSGGLLGGPPKGRQAPPRPRQEQVYW